jgi:predicted O-methyltransferase YrrM
MDHSQIKAILHGYYATRVYLPLSGLSRRWQRFSKHARGKRGSFLQPTHLPVVSWKQCTKRRLIKLWESEKENGNVRISELGVLSALAGDCRDGSNIFEIGTFDGRTTLNLALSAPAQCMIYTLDLPPDLETTFSLAADVRYVSNLPKPGTRYEAYREAYPVKIGRIHQLLGDSGTFDYTPYRNSCSLVFVDGAHSYDYAISDTRAAMDMIERGGVVVWHDYGVWEGVTKALEELEQQEGYGLRSISGTSLVFWKKA